MTCSRQIIADSATPTSISTITATIIPEASARAADSMIRRTIPRSAPMNSPAVTPNSANEIVGDGEASSRATLTKPKIPHDGKRGKIGLIQDGLAAPCPLDFFDQGFRAFLVAAMNQTFAPDAASWAAT